MPTLSRRDFLVASAAGTGAVLMPSLVIGSDGEPIRHITIKKASQVLFEDVASPLWTYGGKAPGPEIRVMKGERVRVQFTNELDEPTSVHWHGIRIENAMDGVSGMTQDPIAPGESFTYDFVAPDAGTYWYHAHNRSWNQVARGLYGPLIIDETEVPFAPERDITLVLDDWRLNQDGVLDVDSLGHLHDWSHAGRLGNWLTVNGESLPSYTLEKRQPHRLRFINASNARILELDPNAFGAQVLAYDGQALPEPLTLPYAPLLLGPAQRVDLLVQPTEAFQVEEISHDEPYSFLAFEMKDTGTKTIAAPALTPNAIPEPDLAKATEHKLLMQGGAMGGHSVIRYKGEILDRDAVMETGQVWVLNGNANLTEVPMFRAKRGETIVIETVNGTRWPHAMHIHGHHFRILERSGSDLDEGQPWRDTFLIGPEQTTKIAFVADNPGKWVFHCHMLEHAAAGMNTWFEVVG